MHEKQKTKPKGKKLKIDLFVCIVYIQREGANQAETHSKHRTVIHRIQHLFLLEISSSQLFSFIFESQNTQNSNDGNHHARAAPITEIIWGYTSSRMSSPRIHWPIYMRIYMRI